VKAKTKTDIIRNVILSALGTDVLNVDSTVPPELEISEADYLTGLTAYYTACPYTNGVSRNFNLLATQAVIDLKISRPSQSEEWEFMGIIGEGRKFNLTSNLLDMRLTGIPISFMYTNPLTNLYYSTVIDQNVGKPEYFVDEIQQKIHIVSGGDWVESLSLAWMSTDVERIHIRHLIGVAKLISLTYYQRILATRTQVQFATTDYKIDIAVLQQAFENNKTESEEWLKKIRKYIMVKG